MADAIGKVVVVGMSFENGGGGGAESTLSLVHLVASTVGHKFLDKQGLTPEVFRLSAQGFLYPGNTSQ